jgi:RHS repeat-associated protein
MISTNRYTFSGKEKQTVKDLGWFDFTARMLSNSEIPMFTTQDPLAEKYYSVSPYAYCMNNPVNIVDPTGESGEAVIDELNKKIIVNVHMVYYGTAATSDIAKNTSSEIQTMWNNANGTVKIKDVEYSVSFSVTSEVVTEDRAVEMAASNTSATINFIRVEENGDINRSFFRLSENAGYFVTSDNLGSSTTAAHEKGHGFGLNHSAVDQRGRGRPDIMSARGTLVDSEYQYNPKAVAGDIGGTVNPTTRIVQQKNITDMFNGVRFVNGKANIGRATNIIYNLNGTRK